MKTSTQSYRELKAAQFTDPQAKALVEILQAGGIVESGAIEGELQQIEDDLLAEPFEPFAIEMTGGTSEFKAPGTFKPITEMVGGGPFGLKPGQWIDDPCSVPSGRRTAGCSASAECMPVADLPSNPIGVFSFVPRLYFSGVQNVVARLQAAFLSWRFFLGQC